MAFFLVPWVHNNTHKNCKVYFCETAKIPMSIIIARESEEARLDQVCNSWPAFVEPASPGWPSLCKFVDIIDDLQDYYYDKDLQVKFVDSKTTSFQLFVLNNGFLNDPNILKFHKSSMRTVLKRTYSEALVDKWPECATDILPNRNFTHLTHFSNIRTRFIKAEIDAFARFLKNYLWLLSSCPSPKLEASLFARYRAEELQKDKDRRFYTHRAIKCARYYMRYQFPIGHMMIRDIRYCANSQMDDYYLSVPDRAKCVHMVDVGNRDKLFRNFFLWGWDANRFHFESGEAGFILNAQVVEIVDLLVQKLNCYLGFIRDILEMAGLFVE